MTKFDVKFEAENTEFNTNFGEFSIVPGQQGPQGETGVGIQSVEQTTTSTEDGGTNIVTVTKTDGTSSTFQVKNGSKGSTGPAGADGKDGAPGADGQDGTTPTIGDNGNWYIGDTDTGKPSRGEIGPAGADGITGADGKSAYQYAQDGVIYHCSRDTINPVYNALADLVGIYVEIV